MPGEEFVIVAVSHDETSLGYVNRFRIVSRQKATAKRFAERGEAERIMAMVAGRLAATHRLCVTTWDEVKDVADDAERPKRRDTIKRKNRESQRDKQRRERGRRRPGAA